MLEAPSMYEAGKSAGEILRLLVSGNTTVVALPASGISEYICGLLTSLKGKDPSENCEGAVIVLSEEAAAVLNVVSQGADLMPRLGIIYIDWTSARTNCEFEEFLSEFYGSLNAEGVTRMGLRWGMNAKIMTVLCNRIQAALTSSHFKSLQISWVVHGGSVQDAVIPRGLLTSNMEEPKESQGKLIEAPKRSEEISEKLLNRVNFFEQFVKRKEGYEASSPTDFPQKQSLARAPPPTISLQQYSPPDRAPYSEIDVLCINCFECISVEGVDAHSKTCLQPLLTDTETSSVDLRISKLLRTIQERQNSAFGQKILLLMQLQELANAALQKSLDSCSLLSSLEHAAGTGLSDEFACSVFARRLMFLVRLKGPFSPLKAENEDALKALELEAGMQQKELERWVMRSEVLLQLLNKPHAEALNEISSDVGSDLGSVFSFSTVGLIGVPTGEDDQEKYFYSLCIRQKREGNNQEGCVSIDELYERVKSEGVAVQDWEQHVKEFFK